MNFKIYGTQAEISRETLHGRIGQEGKIERETLYSIFEEFNPRFIQVFMYFLDIYFGVYKWDWARSPKALVRLVTTQPPISPPDSKI